MPKKKADNGLFGNMDAPAKGAADGGVKKKEQRKRGPSISTESDGTEEVKMDSRLLASAKRSGEAGRGNDRGGEISVEPVKDVATDPHSAETASRGDHVFGVAEFIEILNTFFKRQEARITGEVCEFKRAFSGHAYFTLKDKKDGAVLDCIVWNRNYDLSGVKLEVGMEVILSGHPSIYPASGRLSFVADTVELVGEGALKKAYDALKKKLEAEGLFAPERKRALPDFVRKIGIVTSLKGAVIHDFENNLGKFGFMISVCDSRVEGQQAVKPILAALRTLAKTDIEALVVIRGGGSLESLQAFNNEAVVRAIVNFPVPVIAGIGHDQDVPLAALAADFMVSTPTAAAHLLGRSWEEAFAKAERLVSIFIRFEEALKRAYQTFDGALFSVLDRISNRLALIKEQLNYAERAIVLNDPARQLKLGYAIVRQNGKILKSVHDVSKGDDIETQLNDGIVQSVVEKINNQKK
jgi:exodeoxyribonuclease VII large subunit